MTSTEPERFIIDPNQFAMGPYSYAPQRLTTGKAISDSAFLGGRQSITAAGKYLHEPDAARGVVNIFEGAKPVNPDEIEPQVDPQNSAK